MLSRCRQQCYPAANNTNAIPLCYPANADDAIPPTPTSLSRCRRIRYPPANADYANPLPPMMLSRQPQLRYPAAAEFAIPLPKTQRYPAAAEFTNPLPPNSLSS